MADSPTSAPAGSIQPQNMRIHMINVNEIEKGAATEVARDYEFFVTTQEPQQPGGSERGLIRRLVMKNFFETKSADHENSTSKNNSASTVQAKKQLKNRFRLSKVGIEKEPIKKEKKSTKKEKSGLAKPRSRRVVLEISGRADEVFKRSKSCEDEATEGERCEQRGSKPARRKSRDKGQLLHNNPSTHLFDPFDVLPVPGTPELDILFKLYKSGSKANSIAVNAKNTWWSFVANDAGLLHATLATWAWYGLLVSGLEELRVAKLRHKNEAIKEINSKIGKPGGDITDELVGTVLTLASFEHLVGAYDAAQLHMAALKRMVNARGGLVSFGHNDGLMRGIIWVDFHTATAFHTSPSFQKVLFDSDTPPLPDTLLEEAACTSPTSLLQLSLGAVDCFNIFYRLHRLGLAASAPYTNRVDRLTLSNLLYETELNILSIPYYSRHFLEYDLEHIRCQDEECTQKKKVADAASVVEGILTAAQIFIYAALREIPTTTQIFNILTKRLRVAIDRPNTSATQIWEQEKNGHMLLWTLVVACLVQPVGIRRAWWVGKLMETTESLEIRDRAQLENKLKRVAWTDAFFGSSLQVLWNEISQHPAEMWGPNASFEAPNLVTPAPSGAPSLSYSPWDTPQSTAYHEADNSFERAWACD